MSGITVTHVAGDRFAIKLGEHTRPARPLRPANVNATPQEVFMILPGTPSHAKGRS